MNTSPESLDTPRFPTKAALAAAQLTQALFHKWSRQGVKPIDAERGDKPVPGGGRGKQNLYTFRGVLRLAITAELAGWGLSPDKALAAAREFTDSAAGPAGYQIEGETPAERDLRQRQHPDYREPGGLFKDGQTLLVVDRTGNAEVINFHSGDELELTSRSAIVFDMAQFCSRIETALGPASNVRDGD